MHSCLLYGAGGHAKVVFDALVSRKVKVLGIFDDQKSGLLMNTPILGIYDFKKFSDSPIIISIGDNYSRYKVSKLIKHELAVVIHPSALLARDVCPGPGSIVLHNATIQTGVQIGWHCVVNSGSIIEHDCIVGNFAHVAPGAVLCGNVYIGEGALIGAGSVILPGIKIGAWAIVGAGSVVTSDVEDYNVVVGCPARIIKKLSPQSL